MTNLFKKALVFTDIHYGLKSNSDTHNRDCTEYISWMISAAKQYDCDTCLFLGDYFHNRNHINLKTLHYAQQGLEALGNAFKRNIFIPGNHDCYLRESREINSVNWCRNIPNIEIFNDTKVIGNCVFVPWLVGDEHHGITQYQEQYMFGHFELPNFLMNSAVVMPDIGEMKSEAISKNGTVYTGHFHKRQNQGNIVYMGNAFPHSFSDAFDDERGCMILEWDKPPIYLKWPDAPKYRVYNLSDVIMDADNLLIPNSYVQVNLDVDLNYEEGSFLKESFSKEYNLREISFIPVKNQEHEGGTDGKTVVFETVDQIVVEQIAAIKSETYDQGILLSIWNDL